MRYLLDRLTPSYPGEPNLRSVYLRRASGAYRELLTCPKCGLMEDSTLYTCRSDDPNSDTGLGFVECDGSERLFRCLACGTEIISKA